MERTKEDIEEELGELIERKDELEEEIGELEDYPDEDEYNDFLDGCYPLIKIGCCTFSPSQVLSECDETAYNEGLNEYYSERTDEKKEELEEVQGKIKELEDELEAMGVKA